MQKITSGEELRAAILLLENKQQEEGKLLKQQFRLTYESLKPVNLIKNAFKEVTQSPDLKGKILETSLGLAAGYLSKGLLVRGSGNPFKKILGTVLQMGITNIVTKHPEFIKSAGAKIINKFFNKPKVDQENEDQAPLKETES